MRDIYVPNYYCKVPLDTKYDWDLNCSPHALIYGDYGMGKTYFLFYLISAFARYDSTFFICDPKRSKMKRAGKYLKLQRASIECSKKGIARNIRLAKETMFRRNKILSASGSKYYDFYGFRLKPAFLVIDNFSDYLAFCEEGMREEAIESIRQILSYGERAGVFVVLASQNCDSDIVPDEMLGQFGFKAVLGYAQGLACAKIFGEENIPKNSCLVPGFGFATMKVYDDTPFEFSVPFIKDSDKLLDYVSRNRHFGDLDVKQREGFKRLVVGFGLKNKKTWRFKDD